MTTLEERPATSTTPAAPLPERAAAARGWYRDPADCHEFRFWDGARWTPGVADNGFVREVPLPDEPCAPVDERARPPLRAVLIGVGALVLGFAGAAVIALALKAAGLDSDVWMLVLTQASLWGAMVGAMVFVTRRYGSGSIAATSGSACAGPISAGDCCSASWRGR